MVVVVVVVVVCWWWWPGSNGSPHPRSSRILAESADMCWMTAAVLLPRPLPPVLLCHSFPADGGHDNL